MRTLDQINEQISALENELQHVEGTKTEVYTRIVGYYRSVTNWNKGKGEEYKHRRTFSVNERKLTREKIAAEARSKQSVKKAEQKKEEAQKSAASREKEAIDNSVYYKVFYSQFCRNCSPVKDYLNETTLQGEAVDVGSDLGLNVARKFDIRTTPTVLFFDKKDDLIGRAHSVEELKELVVEKESALAV